MLSTLYHRLFNADCKLQEPSRRSLLFFASLAAKCFMRRTRWRAYKITGESLSPQPIQVPTVVFETLRLLRPLLCLWQCCGPASFWCRSRSGSGLASKRCRFLMRILVEVLLILDNHNFFYFKSQHCTFTMFQIFNLLICLELIPVPIRIRQDTVRIWPDPDPDPQHMFVRTRNSRGLAKGPYGAH